MKIAYIILISIVTAGLGFFGGMKYSESRVLTRRGNFTGQFSPDAAGRNSTQMRFSTRPVSGEIISVDGSSITVKLPDGQSKIVILTDDTTVIEASQAGKSDLKEGSKVAVFGTENSDGSIAAGNIQLNPLPGRFGNIER